MSVVKGMWTCQRVTSRVKCGAINPNRRRNCETCGKPRPARKRPAHLSALKLPYSYYIAINGGERCGICDAPASASRKLDRDHEHVGVGYPRGLLCWSCNRQLKHSSTIAWLRAAADYLERAESRRPTLATEEAIAA